MKICVIDVDSQLLGTDLDCKFSGGGMVKSDVQPEHRKIYPLNPIFFNSM